MHWKYFRHLLIHKYWVFRYGLRLNVPIWRLIVHDWSKFTPAEWFPYAEWFYGYHGGSWRNAPDVTSGSPPRANEKKHGKEAAFDIAWLIHQNRNAHHWQFWLLQKDSGSLKALEMPESYAREMVADWLGAGKAVTGREGVVGWYIENENKIILHPATRRFVERLVRGGDYRR